jgi:hypothetical protein
MATEGERRRETVKVDAACVLEETAMKQFYRCLVWFPMLWLTAKASREIFPACKSVQWSLASVAILGS